MKKIFSEYQNDYSSYTFSYAHYAILENLKDLSEIYEGGYLPYTGSPDLENHFYFCRSARINLEKFKQNSENKRVLKKQTKIFTKKFFANFQTIPKELGAKVFEMYLNYFHKIHGEKVMGKKRLELILNSQYQNKNVLYFEKTESDEEVLVGGMIMVTDLKKQNMHVWYLGYEQEYKNTGFGIWMFLEQIEAAKNEGYKYFYLGTCYGEKAKYKLNFEGLEYFDGNVWVCDIKRLKELIKKDKERKGCDLLKENLKLF